MASKNLDSVLGIGEATGYPMVTPKEIIPQLERAILVSLYAHEEDLDRMSAERKAFKQELNKKVMRVYKQITGSDFNPDLYANASHNSTFLLGPPGHGKTASFMAAAESVCAKLELKMVKKFGPKYEPQHNHFVFVMHQSAGENSALTYAGIPYAKEEVVDGKPMKVLDFAVKREFTYFDRTAGGVLLFDDASNALRTIQDVQLQLSQFGTYQSLDVTGSYIGYTGNLGSMDGTNASELSSALVSRVVPYYISDRVDDFIARTYKNYSDELGDAFVVNFLKRNNDNFAQMPKDNKPFACPRSWNDFIKDARFIIMENGGRGQLEKSEEEIKRLAISKLGKDVGFRFRDYYSAIVVGADPLARKYIETGKFDKDEFSTKYKGTSDKDLNFGFQFSTAVGDYFVNAVSKHKNKNGEVDPFEGLEVYIERYGKCILALNDSEFSFALDHMRNKLANAISDFSQNNKHIEGAKELNMEIKKTIAKGILTSSPDATEDHKDLIATVLVGMDKLPNYSVAQERRRKVE